MFEQSILIDHATGKRTGAVAVSLTVQAIVVGTLLIIPLIYNDRLPDVRPWTSLILPPGYLPPPPEPMPAAKPSTAAHSTLAARRVFHVSATPTEPRGPVFIEATALPDAGVFFDGVPSPLGATQLSRLGVVSSPSIRVTVTLQPPEKPRSVGGDVQAAKIVKRVLPVYPLPAKLAHISGTVRLVGVIAKDGTIQRLEVESGNPLLVNAALAAVRQWVYRPTLLNGEAIEVIAPISVIFTLQ